MATRALLRLGDQLGVDVVHQHRITRLQPGDRLLEHVERGVQVITSHPQLCLALRGLRAGDHEGAHALRRPAAVEEGLEPLGTHAGERGTTGPAARLGEAREPVVLEEHLAHHHMPVVVDADAQVAAARGAHLPSGSDVDEGAVRVVHDVGHGVDSVLRHGRGSPRDR